MVGLTRPLPRDLSSGQRGHAEDADKHHQLERVLEELRELKSELSQVTYEYNSVGKVVINKEPAGHASPNRADSLMIAFALVVSSGFEIIGVW